MSVLRKASLGTVAEIVRISYWIARKEDGTTCYQVNLISPHPAGFHKNQPGTVSVDSGHWPTESDFERLLDLLHDVRRYLEVLRRHDCLAGGE